MVAYEDVGVRLGRKVGYRAPVGLGGCLDRSQPSPLGWAEETQAFGPESRRWLRDLSFARISQERSQARAGDRGLRRRGGLVERGSSRRPENGRLSRVSYVEEGGTWLAPRRHLSPRGLAPSGRAADIRACAPTLGDLY